jgi:hypothetical protein
MAKMSDKTKRAINKGRRKAGLKPIKFGAKKNNPKSKKVKIDGTKSALDTFLKEHFKGKSDADLRRIVRTKKGNTDDEGYELGRRKRN